MVDDHHVTDRLLTAASRPRTLRSRYMRRVGATFVAAVSAFAAFLPAPADPVDAARDDAVAVVVEGIGFGHGRGMSQWGAYGWAVDQGRDWRWILDHYYGGTALGDAPSGSGRIKVRLLDLDGQSTVGMVSHGSGIVWNGINRASMYARETSPGTFDVYGSNSRACPGATALVVPDGTYAQGAEGTAVRQIQTFLKAHHDAAIVIDGDFGPQTKAILTSWQQSAGLPATGVWDGDDATKARAVIGSSTGTVSWTKLGTASGTLTFTTPTGESSGSSALHAIGLCEPGGSVTHYRGEIEVLSTSDGNRVVNDVKTEDYLRGVVPKEISASWAQAGGGAGADAVRAQAVAARSYGLSQNRYSYASTCDSQACQVYFGAASRATANGAPTLVEDYRTDQAIAATAGKVRLWPNGSIVSTEFSASNGPRTAGGAFPPVDDVPGDATANNPNHRWTRVLDADALAARYGLGELDTASMVEAAAANYRDFDGVWFNDVLLEGTDGSAFRQQAWDFRRDHDLPSPGFTVRVVTEDTRSTRFAMIGDSVGESIAAGASSEFQALTDGTFRTATIDVYGGRCTTKASCRGSSGLEVANSLPTGLDLVVVELGYNDWPPDFAGDIDAMMTALQGRGVRQVAWVNLAEIRRSGGTSHFGPANAALQAATARWSNLTVLDWNAASDTPERSRWFSDDVHLTSTGQAEFALWLREQILALAPSHWLAPPQIIELPVAGSALRTPDGQAVTVPADASAVALNVTVVDAVKQGYVTVWPCGIDRPLASNVNFPPGSRVANGVIAPIGDGGSVCFYSHAGTDLVVDVAGWFSGDAFVGATPRRVVDTRDGTGGRSGRVTPSTPLTIPVTGAPVTLPDGSSATVPDGVGAVALNVTVVDPVAAGYVTVWPCDVARPLASNVNFRPGARVANGVVAPVGADGSVCLYSHEPSDIVVDLAGWFDPGAAEPASDPGELGSFTGATPRRFVDTRDGTGGRTGRVTPSDPVRIPVRGAALTVDGVERSIPTEATAVALNLTIVDPLGQGYATVWPCGAERPTASNINFLPGTRVANSVVAPIGSDGSVCVYTHRDAHVVVDVAGWFGGDPAGFTGATPERFVDTRYALGPAPS